MSSPADHSELASMLDAALAGSRAVMRVYAGEFAVEHKADGSPVSRADREAEAAIVALLAPAFPEVPIVAEEAASEGPAPETNSRFLLVDPLDGTKEFISRNGEFTVNVGLIEAGMPVAGVVLAPALGLAYAGSRGSAWTGRMTDPGHAAEWRPIRVCRPGARPVAVASRSHSTPATEAALAAVGAGERRAIGSSLKFCLLAAGEADFYPRLGPTMEWDTAAGDAVLRAAGGVVTTLDGAPLRYGKVGVAGMREFENPHFLAAGNAGLILRCCVARSASG